MDVFEPLRDNFDRVEALASFDSDQEIWWIYLRAVVSEALEQLENLPLDSNPPEIIELRAALEPLKDAPHTKPNEEELWFALRDAVDTVLRWYER
ncbi:MAG: hypothetical protein AAF494_00635 [Pseudomonadota bacterium]